MAVNIVFPPLAVGAPAILTHFPKLLLETCNVPLQTVFAVLIVIEEGLAGLLNVTLIEVPAGTAPWPSAGAVAVTTNGVGIGVIVGVLVGTLLGVLVVDDGKITGKTPGRALRGPGYRKSPKVSTPAKKP